MKIVCLVIMWQIYQENVMIVTVAVVVIVLRTARMNRTCKRYRKKIERR
jgi:hypothetical protein